MYDMCWGDGIVWRLWTIRFPWTLAYVLWMSKGARRCGDSENQVSIKLCDGYQKAGEGKPDRHHRKKTVVSFCVLPDI